MEREHKFGKMELNMKEIGEMEWLKDKGSFTMLMVTYTQGSFIKIGPMGLESIFIKMVRNTKGSGKMINRKALGRKN